MGLYEKARELAASVKATREFAELKRAKADIDRNRELKREVDTFVKRQTEIFTSNKSQREVEAKVAELNKKFQSLSKIPEVTRFLNAGKEFNNMMARAYKMINESIDAELK